MRRALAIVLLVMLVGGASLMTGGDQLALSLYGLHAKCRRTHCPPSCGSQASIEPVPLCRQVPGLHKNQRAIGAGKRRM